MKPKKQDWIVRMKREVITDVYVQNCTEDEARNDPWSYVSDEKEIDQRDWEVLSVEPND